MLIPALFYHLGVVSIFLGVDEATRALVSWEMMLSGEYFTPTINGEFYYKKPPLYNWILILFFKLFGYSEFVMRIPNVLALFAFAYVVYYFNHNHFKKLEAILLALMIITCARVFFWESYFAYIDILFSMIIYTMIMSIHYFYLKDKMSALFIISYILCAIAYLLKGLPAIVFLGISLLSFFIWKRKLKQLFSLGHFMGMASFSIILFSYYFLYQYNNDLDAILSTLWEESIKRTASRTSFLGTIKHLLSFPFEMIYHYLPWTLFVPFLFTKIGRQSAFGSDYSKFCLLMFSSNILVYWISPNVYPKYILMLVPLIYTVAFAAYQKNKPNLKRYLNNFFLITMLLLMLFCFSIPFLFAKLNLDYLLPLCFIFAIIIAILSYQAFKKRELTMVLFILSLMFFRIIHTDVVWVPRDNKFASFKNDALELKKIIGEEEVWYLNWQAVQHANTFYLSHLIKKIIPIEKSAPKKNVYYIVKGKDSSLKKHSVYYKYYDVQKKEDLTLIKFE